jgi:F0F1-type ATP synthase assembly protein I
MFGSLFVKGAESQGEGIKKHDTHFEFSPTRVDSRCVFGEGYKLIKTQHCMLRAFIAMNIFSFASFFFFGGLHW